MSRADQEEPAWFVKGTVHYVLDDGSCWDEEMLVRNIFAPDQSTAAATALTGCKAMVEVKKGRKVSETRWIDGPHVSPFDPYLDR
jgi:hypothetical protein